jgi:sugar/nucleoside kinase (ribokinase family)
MELLHRTDHPGSRCHRNVRGARARAAGCVTSLDLSQPDPAAPGGQADWPRILRRALPHVDVFLPSIDELLFMLDRPRFDRFQDNRALVDADVLGSLSERLLEWGVGIVGLKLGDQGFYLRTHSDRARLERATDVLRLNADAWLGRELWSPCYVAELAGATGAGDCAIAGLLAALLKGLSPEGTLNAAVAAGACNVEQPDAVSGIPTWEHLQQRIAAGWQKAVAQSPWSGWRWDAERGIACAPRDAAPDDR